MFYSSPLSVMFSKITSHYIHSNFQPVHNEKVKTSFTPWNSYGHLTFVELYNVLKIIIIFSVCNIILISWLLCDAKGVHPDIIVEGMTVSMDQSFYTSKYNKGVIINHFCLEQLYWNLRCRMIVSVELRNLESNFPYNRTFEHMKTSSLLFQS